LKSPRIRAGLAFIPLALLASSCRAAQQEPGRLEPLPGWSSPAKPTDEHVQGETLPGVEVIAVTPHNRALQDHPGRRVVRDSSSWREVWEQASSTLEVPPLPTVNFRDEMVLAATSGPFDIDGRFTMDSIMQSGRRVLAVVTREIGCGPTGTIMGSGPTVFIRVPARREVKFIERERYMPGCS
jgi:hypothetical protein